MNLALNDAGICASDVDYINAHGTSTPAGDAAEAAAITSVFENNPLVSSTKGMTGHLMGASGIIETIACIHVVCSGNLPVNVGTDHADESLGLKLVTKENRKQNIDIALSNAMGFGGQNSCIIVGKHKE